MSTFFSADPHRTEKDRQDRAGHGDYDVHNRNVLIGILVRHAADREHRHNRAAPRHGVDKNNR